MIRSRFGRILTLALALAQFALPGVASIADAFAERGSARSVAHIEDPATAHCPRVHTEDCVLCRTLNGKASAPRPAPVPAAVRRQATAYSARTQGAPSLDLAWHPPTRAPPVLVHGLG
jgi:hypothetical protein